MDIGILNSLGYIEVIEISIWLGVMYYGKCWIDSKFKQEYKMYGFIAAIIIVIALGYWLFWGEEV